MAEQQALLQVALKSLNTQQRLWRYLKLHDFKLPIEFMEFKDSYGGKALVIWLDHGTVVYIKHFLVEKFEKINGMELSTMRHPHSDHGKPIIKRSENLVEIGCVIGASTRFCVIGASTRFVLRSFPKDQELNIARVEVVLRNFVPKDQAETFTDTWIASHEYPLELQPFVNNVLEKAIGKFGWLK